MPGSQDPDVVTVGFAFLPKKLPRVLTPELESLATTAGLRLAALDPHVPIDQQVLPQQQQQQQQSREGQHGEQRPAAPPGEQVASTREPDPAPRPLHPGTPGPDVIVHKLHRDPVWEAHLSHYTLLHPHVQLLDPPPAIHATEDRAVMLAAIPPDGWRLEVRLPQGPHQQQQGGQQEEGQQRPSPTRVPWSADSCLGREEGTAAGDVVRGLVAVTVRAPPQRVVRSRGELAQLAAQQCAGGLRPPLIVKTQRADAAGGAGHGLAVAPTWAALRGVAEGLQQRAAAAAGEAEGQTDAAAGGAASAVESGEGSGGEGRCGEGASNNTGSSSSSSWVPLVVQQYVPHSQELYKVYVLGDHIRVTRRATLTRERLRALQGDSHPGGHHQQEPGHQQSEQPGHQHGEYQQQGENVGLVPGQGQTEHQLTVGAAAQAAAYGCAGGLPLMLHNLSAEPQLQSRPQPQPQAPRRDNCPDAAAGAAREASAGGVKGVPGSEDVYDNNSNAVLDERVMQAVARELSRRMGLTLFNFDVVLPDPEVPDPEVPPSPPPGPPEASGQQEASGLQQQPGQAGQVAGVGVVEVYVVDVNYFPGYDKLPGWEELMVAHLRAAADVALAARGRVRVGGQEGAAAAAEAEAG